MEASKRRGVLKRRLARMLALAAGVAALDCGPAIGAAERAHHGPAGYLRDQHPPGRRGTRRPPRRRAGDRRRRRGRSAGGYRRPLGHRHRHDHHRRVVDRHHRAGDRALARADAAGRAGARAGHPDAQPVRHGERRVDQRRHARLRRRRDVEHAGSDQRPPAQRHRHGRRRFQRDPEEQHRADRDHPRQFRRGALRRRCGRRRHQHRHQERRRPAAVGARAGGLRLLQLPGRQSVREYVRENIGRAVRGGGERERDPLRRLSREQQIAPGERGRRFPLDRRARHQRLFQRLRRQPASRAAGRPPRDVDLERAGDQPPRRSDAVRFWREERHQRYARRDPYACGRAPSSSSTAAFGTRNRRPASSARSDPPSIQASRRTSPRCRRRRGS